MASISPFTIHLRVQTSRHSSVQSSFTFKSQMADSPIYLFRFKKIEQGQLLYAKIFPPIFFKISSHAPRVLSCSRLFNG